MKTYYLLYLLVLSLISFTFNENSNPESAKIGNQVWMTKNLDVERFRNGDLIPHAKTKEEWSEALNNKTPAWCYFNNDPKNGATHGKMYNWYAVKDKRGLAPEGWKIPKSKDWEILVSNLKTQADKNKLGWTYNQNTNQLEDKKKTFGGYRHRFGRFSWENQRTYYWTSTAVSNSHAWSFLLADEFGTILKDGGNKGDGNYVRCVRVE
ncbi:MAG: fibrobacter succinogenes major paralogous domain-containing protein [Flavobacteriaceae bacterium]|nr:fibrobacter succinogenes major paralogous domain-containing protein [Flavobacteriaceae bacterium]